VASNKELFTGDQGVQEKVFLKKNSPDLFALL
jgi:hypothetical protein